MVDEDKPLGLDGLQVVFDDERVVCDAGVMVVATLAERLGIELFGGPSGAAALEASWGGQRGPQGDGPDLPMVLGADSIDDTSVLRAGGTRRLARGQAAGGVDAWHVPGARARR